MIFLTVGTHEPFTRLVKTVDAWCAERQRDDVFGQITDRGAADYQPNNFEWVAKLKPAEFDERCREAQVIISHAGMGSIITAASLSKPIVVLPRRGQFGETRNDHQYATVTNLATKPGVFVALTEDELPSVLDAALEQFADLQMEPISPFADPQLTNALRSFINCEEDPR